MKYMNKTNIFIAFFSIVFLSLSVLIYLNVSKEYPHRDSDSIRYEGKADLFYKTNRFFLCFTENNKPIAPQPIGYSFFIGIIYKIFGQHDWPIILIQVLLTLISGFFVLFGATHLFDKQIGLIAFAFFTINIGYLTFAQVILAECLTYFFLAWYFERFTCFIKTKSLGPLLFSGFLLGASTLIKPAALYFIYPSAIFAAILLFPNPKKLLSIPIFVFLFFAPIKAVQAYNSQAYGLTDFTNVGTFNLYIWFWAKVETRNNPKRTTLNQEEIFSEKRKEKMQHLLLNSPSGENWNNLKQQFLTAVKKDPIPFIATWLQEMTKTFFGLFSTNLKVLIGNHAIGSKLNSFFATNGTIYSRIHQYISKGAKNGIIVAIGYFELLWSIIRLVLFIAGLFFLVHRKQWLIILFLISFIGYFTFVSGFDGCARYRVMFEFAILILSAFGFQSFIGNRRVIHA